MASEPFPQPMLFHMTYVQVHELPWPHDGHEFQSICRGCDWDGRRRLDYTVAWRDGQDHGLHY